MVAAEIVPNTVHRMNSTRLWLPPLAATYPLPHCRLFLTACSLARRAWRCPSHIQYVNMWCTMLYTCVCPQALSFARLAELSTQAEIQSIVSASTGFWLQRYCTSNHHHAQISAQDWLQAICKAVLSLQRWRRPSKLCAVHTPSHHQMAGTHSYFNSLQSITNINSHHCVLVLK